MFGPSPLMRSPRNKGSARHIAAGAAFACVLLLGAAFPAGAATYYVDNTNPGCINSGGTAGSASTPYCTISSAASQHPGAGNTIRVLAGTYREQVSVPAAGASGSPFVIEAASPSVTVDGADAFTSAAQWTQVSGDVWLAGGVTWLPKQVFGDGARLAATTVAPASMPAGTFQYVAGTGLYVNAGGGSPAGHGVLVGRRLYGFTMSGRPWVAIRGFTVTRAEDKGILVQSASHQVEITDNRSTLNFKAGIQVSGSNNCLVARNVSWDNGGHGIGLTAGSTGCTIEDNESYRNADPAVRIANGLYLFGAPATLIRRNRLHDNQDSGQHLQSGSNDCASYQNRSWSNGDHGFDHLGATGTIHVGDVAWGNYKDGFSIEGSSGGTQLHDCIAAENGLTTSEFDLWVDQGSTTGFVSDYNLFWKSTAQNVVRHNSSFYASVAAYSAASGQDAHTIQADPRFVNPAAGDFRLLPDSPAIDNANSAVPNWPATDARGLARLDDPAVPNAGAGPVDFADRGAFEFPPTVLAVNPASGTAPLAVIADAGGSLGPDGTAVSYRFDFGDGTIVGPQPGPTAMHTYSAGQWTATVTVTDASGGTGTAFVNVTATAPSVNTLDLRVAAGSDDAEESAAGKSVINGADLDLVYDKSNQTVGMRWTGVEIPRNAIIRAAHVQFTSKDARTEATALAIRGQAADNAPTFTTANYNVSSRPRTTATASWSPAAWNRGDAGAAQRTPELSAVIEEIVGRPGWASGNALALIITGTGRRVAWSYEGNAAAAPLLHVEYAPNFPPVARISVHQIASAALTVTADASATTDTDPAPVASYRFDFGDGSAPATVAAPAAIAQHTYAAAGVYTVTLTATDTRGLVSAPVTASVTVNGAPTARLSATQLFTPPLTVRADASASTDPDPMPIVSYRFNFGDGSPAVTTTVPNAVAQHAYAAAGTYTITVIATDSGGLASAPATSNITIDAPPTARLTATQLASPPLTVNADGSASTDADTTPVASYRFDFGDGSPAVVTTAPTAAAAHSYAAAGSYTITLVATDTGGFLSTPATAVIAVNGAPTARVSLSQLSTPPLTARADASASTDPDPKPIASYRFDFGDGSAPVTTAAPNAIAQHAYAAAGTYTVTVIATDTGGLSSAPATASITLDAPPTARLSVTGLETPPLGARADASASTDGDATPIASYRFDFGDGSAPVTAVAPTAIAQHVYANAGTYSVSVIATDLGGYQSLPATASVAVNARPTARLSAGQIPSPPLTALADASASSDPDTMRIVSYRFDFGDGSPAVVTTSPTATAQYTYAAAGTYTVSVTVTDAGGLVSAPATATVAMDAPPTARLSVAPVASPPLTALADGSASTDTDATPIVSYQFDFGDGSPAVVTTAPVATAQHTYASPGTYTVTLTATDAGGFVSAPATASVTITGLVHARIAAGSDDAEESASGTSRASGNDLELVFDNSNQTVGLRWTSLPIPRGATITTAWVQFTARTSASGATSLTFRGQAADNAATFNNSSFNVSSRPRTTAAAAWAPPAWTSGQSGAAQRTPDLKAVLQEIVNRPGWASGNALALIITGTGQRIAESYNGNSSAAALLHVEFTSQAPPALPPVARLSAAQLPSPALTVRADGSASTAGSAAIASYRFDFGDGSAPVVTTAPTSVAQHTYAAGGTYTVALVVTDAGGLASVPATASVTVTPPAVDNPPVARLTLTPAASPPLTVNADGSASTDADATPIASYRFTFGDGTPAVTTTAPTATAQHTYAAAGSYTVTLVATDTGGQASAPVTATVTVSGGTPASYTLERRVAGWQDDAEEPAGGSVYLTSSDLEIVADGAVIQTVGMRWAGVTIPPGAVITAAWVQFVSKEAQSGAASITIQAQAADNAGAFGSAAGDVSNRTRTVASASWAPVAWAVGDSGANQRTPDLKAVVQEIVNRPGWTSGNAIALVVTGTGRRTAWAYDGNAAAAPLLHVEYTTGSAPALTMSADSEVESGALAEAATDALPGRLSFSLPYPNPSAGVVSFRLELPVSTGIRWGIYDVQGRRIWSEERACGAGRVELSWSGRSSDGSPVGAGVYFARVHAAGRVLARRFARL